MTDLNTGLQLNVSVTCIGEPEDASESIFGQVSNFQNLQLGRLFIFYCKRSAAVLFLSLCAGCWADRLTRDPILSSLTLMRSAMIGGF